MRFLVLATDAYGGHGGIAKYNRDLISALCAMPECKEVVVIPRLIPGEVGSLPRNLTYLTTGVGGKLRYALAVMRMARRKFDLIVCSHINLLPLAVMAQLWIRAPLVLVIYGIEVWQPHGSRMVNGMLSRLTAVISISQITAEKFRAWSRIDARSVHILPNAIHLEHYGVGPKNTVLLEKYGLRGKKVLMTFGRLSANERYKGVDEVIDLMTKLVSNIHDLVYVVAGDGDDRPRLEEKVRGLGLDSHVKFTGFVPESQKADYYRLADAYVMPGRGEGFGFVFLEAMACGVPVVASKLDGSREAVRDGMLGILVDPNNSTELEGGIMQALAKKREVPNGIEYFSYENFSMRAQTILRQLLHSGEAR